MIMIVDEFSEYGKTCESAIGSFAENDTTLEIVTPITEEPGLLSSV